MKIFDNRLLAVSVIALATMGGVTACAAPSSPAAVSAAPADDGGGSGDSAEDQLNQDIDDTIDDAVDDASDVDLDVKDAGATIPAEWPANLPTPPGTVISGVVIDGSPMVGTTTTREEALAYIDELKSLGYSEDEMFSVIQEDALMVTLKGDGGEFSVLGDASGTYYFSITLA